MMIGGLRRQVDDVGEDVMTRKILDELDVSGWEITQKAGREAGFVIDPPTVPTAGGTRRSYGDPELSASGVVFPPPLRVRNLIPYGRSPHLWGRSILRP